MKIFIYGFSLFLLAFLVHFIIWKIRIPERQRKTLLIIFIITLITGLMMIITWNCYALSLYSGFIPLYLSEYLHICLFFTSITLVYIELYSTLETDSPSLLIITTIANSGKDGLNRKELEQSMAPLIQGQIIMDRLRHIIFDNMAYIDKEKYKLTRQGLILVKIFLFYKNLLKIDKKLG